MVDSLPEPETIPGALGRDSLWITPDVMADLLSRWWWHPDQRAGFAQWLRDVANELDAINAAHCDCCGDG